MKSLILAALSVIAISTPAMAEDSACLLTVKNSLVSLEDSAGLREVRLQTISQDITGSTDTITIMSTRAEGLGNKLFIVDVVNREVGENKETICEITNLRTYIEKN